MSYMNLWFNALENLARDGSNAVMVEFKGERSVIAAISRSNNGVTLRASVDGSDFISLDTHNSIIELWWEKVVDAAGTFECTIDVITADHPAWSSTQPDWDVEDESENREQFMTLVG